MHIHIRQRTNIKWHFGQVNTAFLCSLPTWWHLGNLQRHLGNSRCYSGVPMAPFSKFHSNFKNIVISSFMYLKSMWKETLREGWPHEHELNFRRLDSQLHLFRSQRARLTWSECQSKIICSEVPPYPVLIGLSKHTTKRVESISSEGWFCRFVCKPLHPTSAHICTISTLQ